MDAGVVAISIPIVMAIGGFITVIYIRKYANMERMAMIEKGLSTDSFRQDRSPSGALRASLLFIGVGVGLLLGYALDRAFDMEEVGYFSMIFIFGGIGLGLAYRLEEQKVKQG